MATLTLSKCFINLVPTGESVSGFVGPDRTRAHGIAGEVRVFAGGRSRAISAEGESTSVPIRMVAVPVASVETLRSWKGKEVEFRDPYGLQVYGTFFGISVTSYKEGFHNVELVIQATDYTEGV